MSKRIALILALLLLVGILAGCGSGADNAPAPDDSGKKADDKVPDKADDKSGDKADDKGDQSGPSKIVNLGISENGVLLDPLQFTTQGSMILTEMVFEPLVQKTNEGEFVPWLADSWTIDDSGTVWEFKLHKGIKFNNGEDFNADDVVDEFQRLIDGKGEIYLAVSYWDILDKVEKIDDYTVRFTMSKPSATLLISFTSTGIYAGEAYKNEGGDQLFADQKLYGTGPWILEKWVDGQYGHFLKNEDYWNKEKFDSYYDEVYIRHVLESSTAVAAHISGDLNAYCAVGGISPDMFPLYDGTEDRIDLFTMDSGSYDYLGLSFKEGSPFNDYNVRAAFDLCIDRQAICDSILGGKAFVPSNIVTKGTNGYDPNWAPYEYNPDKAKELLEQSSYNGQEIVLSAGTSTMKSEEIMLAISDMANSIGFNTRVNVIEASELAAIRKTGEYDVFMVTAMHFCGDPYMNVFQNRILLDGHHSFYRNEEMFALIEKTDTIFNDTERVANIRQIAEMIKEDHAPHLSICQLQLTYAIDKGITGLDLYLDGNLRYCFVTYDPSVEHNECNVKSIVPTPNNA